jgi:IS5 family transposase
VLDLAVFKGNPPDAPMLVPAITRIKALFGRAPKAVTADRGYGEASIEPGLTALGVKRIAIPRKGRPGKVVAPSSPPAGSAPLSSGALDPRAASRI